MEEAVGVAVRLRPLEADDDRGIIISKNTIKLRHREHVFDEVFREDSSQDDVFRWVEPAVRDVANGVNALIMAYGQTGSGKSHTLSGIIPRAAHAVFDELKGKKNSVHCSQVQIYGDSIEDVFGGETCVVRDTFVQGLSEYEVTTSDDVMALVARGLKRRTRPNDLNPQSSRSHAVLQLTVQVENDEILRRAKLTLVDLAGSEKWSAKADECRDLADELRAINLSLSALGNCIAALAEKATFIPYRDSCLTRLLRDALSGGTRTRLIATATASSSHLDETASTLAFAQRAKCIKTFLKVDDVVDDAVLLRRARKDIVKLQKQLDAKTTVISRLWTKLEIADDRANAADAACSAMAIVDDDVPVTTSPVRRPKPTQQQTCERHGLTECFLCTLRRGDYLRGMVTHQDPQETTRCDRHGLLNCFLCTLAREGSLASKLGIQLDPVKQRKAWPMSPIKTHVVTPGTYYDISNQPESDDDDEEAPQTQPTTVSPQRRPPPAQKNLGPIKMSPTKKNFQRRNRPPDGRLRGSYCI